MAWRCERWRVVAMWLAAAGAEAAAQTNDTDEALIARLADQGQRAAAHAALVARGAKAVPALTVALRSTTGETFQQALATLRDLGREAGGAVPALLELVPVVPDGELCGVIETLADLAPYRAADVVVPHSSGAIRRQRAGPLAAGTDTDLLLAARRLRTRVRFPLDLDDEELVAALDGCNAHRRELAVELLVQRGPRVEAALPALAALLVRPDPRILTTNRYVRLREKAARAIVAIAPASSQAVLAREVLAGRAAATGLERMPERTRALLAELASELVDPPKRRTAVANLVALGEPAATALVGVLRVEDSDLREEALAALRQLGPRAAAAVPALYDELFRLPFEHTTTVLEALRASAPWCTDVVPDFSYSTSSGWLALGGRRLEGTTDVDTRNAFAAAYRSYCAALAVDPRASLRELEAFLDDADVLVRERAMVLLQERGVAARPALPALAGVLDAAKLTESVTTWLEGGGCSFEVRDVTARVNRAAARTILAIAAPDDPLVARAQSVLARDK